MMTSKELAKVTDKAYKEYVKALYLGGDVDTLREKYYQLEREYQKAILLGL